MRTLNDYFIYTSIADVSTAGQVYVAVPDSGRIVKVFSTLAGTIATAPAVLTIKTAGGTVSETISILHTGSAAGDVDTCEPSDNNNVVEGGTIEIETSGASTNTIATQLCIVVRR